MTDKKQDEIVLGPGAKDEKLAAKETKAVEKTAETKTYVTEETK